MRFLQAYYTSCRLGQTGQAGFQFYSHSDGITNAELYELERLCGYEPPLNVGNIQTQEEIDKTLPVSFSYFKLSTGRFGVIQSVMMLKDYSGRPGAHFAHILLMENNDLTFYPIDLYKSDFLRTTLSEAEWSNTEVPELLPILEIPQERIRNRMLTQIQDFLSKEENESNFKKIINSVIDGYPENRRLIIGDDYFRNPLWIASLLYSFPLSISKNLTFSTYKSDIDRVDFKLCATNPQGAKFNFNDSANYNSRYYIFNFIQNKFSETESELAYPQLASSAISISYDRLSELFDFFENFNYRKLDQNIDNILKLYTLSGKFSNTNNNISELIDFLSKYGKKQYLENFLASHKIILEKIISEESEESKNIITLFSNLNEIASITNKNSDSKIIFELYTVWLTSGLFNQKAEKLNQNFINQLKSINQGIILVLSKNQPDFKTRFFNNALFNSFYIYLSDTNTNSFAAYTLIITAQNCEISDYSYNEVFKNNFFIKIVNQFLTKQTPEAVSFLFENLSEENGIVILKKFIRIKSSEFSNSILKAIEKQTYSESGKSDILNEILKTDNTSIKVVFFPYFLKLSSGKRALFQKFYDTIKDENGVSTKKTFILEYIANGLPTDKEIFQLLPELQKLNDEKVLKNAIIGIEDKMSFSLKKEEFSHLDIKEIIEIKRRNKLITPGNFTELKYSLIQLQNEEYKTFLESIKSINSDLNIPANELKNFWSLFLSDSLSLISKKKDFYYLFLLTQKISYNIKGEDAYSTLIKEIKNNSKNNKPLLEYLLKFYFEQDKFEESLNKNRIKEVVQAVFMAQPEKLINSIKDDFYKAAKESKEKGRITVFFNQLEEIRVSTIWGAKVKNMFNSLFKDKG